MRVHDSRCAEVSKTWPPSFMLVTVVYIHKTTWHNNPEDHNLNSHCLRISISNPYIPASSWWCSNRGVRFCVGSSQLDEVLRLATSPGSVTLWPEPCITETALILTIYYLPSQQIE
jgi:hypothetical protein